ncbi:MULTISPECIES: hypothetical protein [unclassified Fusibacter]|uniref:hypothetical protein n=1 Tax=unclassified Fusibacter TaxID=2624464 RepID=UPI001011B5FE|nr:MULTISPECIES: hypothetical protein [unclassified Fusibacter]MCK8059269.1 hypothetical protein [Fusibacter sp. A2]NPE21267.1 hypothetical protein [Fusibacter sp. A1]RXV62532.1 hypothetical protein DWB64_05475 [Fusibacter sp. A1]
MKKLIGALILVLLLAGCQKDSIEYQTITSSLGDINFNMEKAYELKDDEVIENFHMTTYEKADGKQIRIVSEENAAYVVDESVLEEELTQVDEIHVERTEILDIEGFGKVYGALLDDSQLAGMMFYYKFNAGTTVYTILFINGEDFTKEEEAKVKAMITTLKLKEN